MAAYQCLRGEVVIAKDALIIVRAIVLREEAFLAQEVVGFQNERLPDLQRKDALEMFLWQTELKFQLEWVLEFFEIATRAFSDRKTSQRS